MTSKKRLYLILLILCARAEPALGASLVGDFLLEQATGYYNCGKYAQALKTFNKVLLLEPANAQVQKYIADIEQTYAPQTTKDELIQEILNSLEPTQIPQQGPPEYHHGPKAGQVDYRASRFSINSQVTCATGDFDSENNKTTTLTSFSQTFKYIGKIGTLSLRAPYLIRNGGGTTAEESTLVTNRSIPRHADGLGDITLKGEYYWIKESGNHPGIDLNARLKIPTANAERGLGTGRYDFGGGISLTKRFKEVITLIDVGILARQRPAGSSLKPSRVDYSAGIGYRFSKKVSAYLFLDGSTKSSKNSESPLDIILAASYKPRKQFSLNGYLLLGLTESSPDIAASTGITRYF